jgi:hypothetical protein
MKRIKYGFLHERHAERFMRRDRGVMAMIEHLLEGCLTQANALCTASHSAADSIMSHAVSDVAGAENLDVNQERVLLPESAEINIVIAK